MNYDEVSHVVQNDNCILQLGQYVFNKLKSKGNNDHYIRQMMREVGRMVLAAQNVTPLKKVEEFFIPKNFPRYICSEEGSRVRPQNQHISNPVFSTQAWPAVWRKYPVLLRAMLWCLVMISQHSMSKGTELYMTADGKSSSPLEL